MSCVNCNPQQGDTDCTVSLPVTCILHPKKLDRPFYSFYPSFTPYSNPDQGYYEGWTGGIILLTDPIQGLTIDSYKTGDNLCKNYFGQNAIFATFESGFYLPNMNGPLIRI
jgi:hypothetical protein